jgi:hypothetical protein
MDDGRHIPATRAECLTRSEQGDFPQRWFVDEESGLVVRLPRTEAGDNLARFNMQSIWTDEKSRERSISCVDKLTARCPINCGNCRMNDCCGNEHRETNGLKCTKKCEACLRKNTSRTIELDNPFDSTEDGVPYSLVAECNIAAIFDDKATLEFLYTALRTLLEKWEQELIKDIYWRNKTERELTAKYGYANQASINNHKKRILDILKKYFEKYF